MLRCQLCHVLGFIRAAYVICRKQSWGYHGKSVCSLVHGRAVHSEEFKIVIRSRFLIWHFMKNGVFLIFELKEDVLELIVVFKAN